MRSAALESKFDIDFAGYTVPRTGGVWTGATKQRMLAQVGGGAKALRLFIFGPEYAFPNNCYSDVANASRIVKEIAEVSGTVGAVESVLWPAKRPRARVAILAPRSASYWDEWEATGSHATGTCLGGCTQSLLARADAYNAEVFALWQALAIGANVPVDFLSEDGLANRTLTAQYSTIFVTEPNVPAKSLAAAVKWSRAGGVLVLSPFAGRFSEYNEPSELLSDLTGVEQPLQPSNYFGQRWILWADSACYNPQNSWWCNVVNGTTSTASSNVSFSAWGVWSALSKGNATTLAAFSDKSASPAVTSSSVGQGEVIQFGFWPGISWSYSQVSTGPGAQSQPPKPAWAPAAAMLEMLLGVLPEADRKGPVVASLPSVEKPLLLAPDGKSAIITVLDWRRVYSGPCESPCERLAENVTLSATLPFRVATADEVFEGRLRPVPFAQTATSVNLTLSLQYVSVLQLSASKSDDDSA